MAIDYSIFAAEPFDPCAALAVLRPAYMQMIAEGGVKRIKFRDRDTEFQPADAKAMLSLIQQLEADCASVSGRPGRRFAITAAPHPQCCMNPLDPFKVR